MKSSFHNARAAFKGFADWLSGPEIDGLGENEAANLFSGCEARFDHVAAETGESGRGERWLPGLSVDNFS